MTENISKILKENQGVIIISEQNRRYLTSFYSSYGFLLIAKKNSIFLTDSRYIEEAKNTVKDSEICLLTNLDVQMRDFFKKNEISEIFLETDIITVNQLKNLKKTFLNYKIKISENPFIANKIMELRSNKTEDEKEKIRKAQIVAEKAFDEILKFIRPGITEIEIAARINFIMAKSGSIKTSFDTIVNSGENTSKPHAVPTSRKIAAGDFVTMDFGAVFDGYHSDMTRTIAVCKIDGKKQDIYEKVLEAQKIGIENSLPGISCSKVDEVVRSYFLNFALEKNFTHGLGHGVGIEIHEKPFISMKSKEKLKEGNVITIEPGLYFTGEFGIRIEDMIYIGESGNENLTSSPKNLIVL